MARDDDVFLQGLVAERERLLDIQAQAKAAGIKLKTINRLIAGYGNDASDANVQHAIENATKRGGPRISPIGNIPCPVPNCPHTPFVSLSAVSMHLRKGHGRKLPAEWIARYSKDPKRRTANGGAA